MNPKIEFTEAYLNQATSIFEGVQVIESKKAGRTIKYYVFPSKEGVPIDGKINRKSFLLRRLPC
jgi:hypothetical protein